jgi:hypothetical protein
LEASAASQSAAFVTAVALHIAVIHSQTVAFKASSFAQRLLSSSLYSRSAAASPDQGQPVFSQDSSTKTIETGYEASGLSSLLSLGQCL